MRVVCDTSSLIKLRKGGVLNCLGQLFDSVVIPLAVEDECRDPETKASLNKQFFEVATVSHMIPMTGIQRGELEAISLAVERGISVFITDDEKAFKRALEQGLTPIRTFRVLLLAKHKGLIPSVKAVLDAMIAKGEGIQESVYRETLEWAGESVD